MYKIHTYMYLLIIDYGFFTCNARHLEGTEQIIDEWWGGEGMERGEKEEENGE